jgi:fructose-bisphosphate aldolase class II
MTRDQLLTDPEEAAQFVQATQLDALAIAIGTSHGAYKFTREPTGDILAIERIKAINQRIPNTHLVMHGSSSVPQDLLATINQFGGKMKQTFGVPVSEIQKAIKFGVRKINIDTDIRLAMTAAVRKFLAENPDKFDAREWLKPAREAAKLICKQRYMEFGCEGQGAKIKNTPLQMMAAKYICGHEKILEIGGNIGRNSLIMAFILNSKNNENVKCVTCKKEIPSDKSLKSYEIINKKGNVIYFCSFKCFENYKMPKIKKA